MGQQLLETKGYTATNRPEAELRIEQEGHIELGLFHEVRRELQGSGNIYYHEDVVRVLESIELRKSLLESILSSENISPINEKIEVFLKRDALIVIQEDQQREINTNFRSYILYVKPEFERAARLALTDPNYRRNG